jgi:hypothetical protein
VLHCALQMGVEKVFIARRCLAEGLFLCNEILPSRGVLPLDAAIRASYDCDKQCALHLQQ